MTFTQIFIEESVKYSTNWMSLPLKKWWLYLSKPVRRAGVCLCWRGRKRGKCIPCGE